MSMATETTDSVEAHLRYFCKQPSEFGRRVATLLERWVGLHHIPDRDLKRVDFTNDHYLIVKWQQRLATFDFDQLTRLVFLAHDLCIRIEICACNPQLVAIHFHPRKRDGRFCERHPTIETALAAFRKSNPAVE